MDLIIRRAKLRGHEHFKDIGVANGEIVEIADAIRKSANAEIDAGGKLTTSAFVNTHIHADHLSRSRALAEMTGAEHVLPAQDRVRFPFRPVQEGDTLQVGRARLAVVRMPGHTPESTCYVLDDEALFTGDTLFLTAVGRPDLGASGQEAEARARLLYRSLRRLARLGAGLLVLPGHTDRPVPFDGRPLAARLDETAARLPEWGSSEDEFVQRVLDRLPPAPENHMRILEANLAGVLPEGDVTELEAGANRCAVSV